MAGIRIQTTHVGSLPGPPDFDATALHDEESLRAAVEWVVEQQRAAGIDIINEGELTKGGDWLSFADRRLGGFEERPFPPGGSMVSRGQDRSEFADFYKYATERQTLFFTPDERIKLTRRYTVATAPVSYVGMRELTREIDVLRWVVSDPHRCFLTSTAPSSLEVYRGNEYYKTPDEYVLALAEALRVEYEAIVFAGFQLQVDDAWLVALWDRIGIDMGLERVQEVLHGSHRGAQSRVAQHPRGSRSLSPLLGKLARSACLRPAARGHRGRDARGEGEVLLVRSGQRPARARVPPVGTRAVAARARSSCPAS